MANYPIVLILLNEFAVFNVILTMFKFLVWIAKLSVFGDLYEVQF